MSNSHPRWELGGLYTETGPLERLLPVGELMVPNDVELEGEWLCWGWRGDPLQWTTRRPAPHILPARRCSWCRTTWSLKGNGCAGPVGANDRVWCAADEALLEPHAPAGPPHILSDFVGTRWADDQWTTRRPGPHIVISSGSPTGMGRRSAPTHVVGAPGHLGAALLSLGQRGRHAALSALIPQGGSRVALRRVGAARTVAAASTGGRWLERWRHFARQARAILDLAASLHADQPGQPEDWQVVVQHRKQPVPWWRPSVEVEWILLSSVVQEWIRIGDVRPVMARGPTQGRQVEFGSSAGGTCLFGTLACQLLFTITRVTSVAVCSACAAIYTPTRRPRPDQRRYCQSCRDGGVPQRDAQRDRQRRRRAALPSTDRT